MKIAITGHTAGIGKALAEQYSNLGHEIVGLSKRDGYNIRVIPKIANLIEPCDMFINNAQAGYSQTELLFEMANRWKGTNKHILSISTTMTQQPASILPGLDMDQYRVQKIALEEAIRQIRNRNLCLRLSLVRPGNVATSPEKTVPPAADVTNWASTLVQILILADNNNLALPDLSLTAK